MKVKFLASEMVVSAAQSREGRVLFGIKVAIFNTVVREG